MHDVHRAQIVILTSMGASDVRCSLFLLQFARHMRGAEFARLCESNHTCRDLLSARTRPFGNEVRFRASGATSEGSPPEGK